MVTTASLKWSGRFLRYAPLLIWIVIVLGLGSGLGATNETSRFIRPLLEFLFPDAIPETLAIYHGYIRKFAHFAEYAILALLAYRAFRPRRPWALVLVVVIAITDETNQSFSDTRTASAYDVLLDIFGGLTMLVAIWLVERHRHSAIQNRPFTGG